MARLYRSSGEKDPHRRSFGGAGDLPLTDRRRRRAAGRRGRGRRRRPSPCGRVSWRARGRPLVHSGPRFVSRGGISSRTRSRRSRSMSRGASALTSAPRPAASPTACCSAAPRVSPRSTSPTARSRCACGMIPGDRDRAAERREMLARRPPFVPALARSTSPSSRWPRCCRRSPPAWRPAASCSRWSSPSSSSAASGSAGVRARRR